MVEDALIGATGFVGGLLSESHEFPHKFDSSSVAKLAGKSFSTVYCAALPGRKWMANKDSASDTLRTHHLIEALDSISVVTRFVLISTVDVYSSTDIVFEDDKLHHLSPRNVYGMNRRILECFVRSRFPSALIVRLPAIIGKNASKGPLFDIKNENVGALRRESSFQWYPGNRIYEDTQRLLGMGVKLANLVTPPISLSDLCVQFGKSHLIPEMFGTVYQHYDVRTNHSFESQPYTRTFPAKEIEEYLSS